MGKEICKSCQGTGEVWVLNNPYSYETCADSLVPCICTQIRRLDLRPKKEIREENRRALTAAIRAIQKAFGEL